MELLRADAKALRSESGPSFPVCSVICTRLLAPPGYRMACIILALTCQECIAISITCSACCRKMLLCNCPPELCVQGAESEELHRVGSPADVQP